MPFPKKEIEYSQIAFEASALAYLSAEKIEKWGLKKGYAIHTFECEECFAFIAWGNNKIIVVYRGTNDIRDWLKNADARKIKVKDNVYDFRKVHKGFYDYMMLVGRDINKKLKELLSKEGMKNCEIIFTGHSLGAAAITDFVGTSILLNFEINPDKCHIHPVASPRCGNAQFRDKLEGRFINWYRWVNSSDAVPHLPFALPKHVRMLGGFLSKPFAYFMPGGLRHVGNLCWLDVCNKLKYNPSLAFQWKDIVMGWVNHIGTRGLAMVRNHFIHNYVLSRDVAFHYEEEKNEVD